MKSPVHKNLIPRGGWSVTFPETGYTVSENHPSTFLQKCHQHMEGNGIEIHGDWQERLFHMACEQHPEIECLDSEEPKARSMTGQDVWRFVTTLWKSMEAGAVQVPAGEQERRLNICKNCPKMGVVSCGFGCGKLSEVLNTLTIGSPAPISHELHKKNCLVCGCSLSAMASYPIEVIRSVDRQLGFDPENYPDICWKYH